VSVLLTNVYDVIRQAIIDRQQVVCLYNGYVRECCPHAIGTTNGTARVLVYQFAGDSSRGAASGRRVALHGYLRHDPD